MLSFESLRLRLGALGGSGLRVEAWAAGGTGRLKIGAALGLDSEIEALDVSVGVPGPIGFIARDTLNAEGPYVDCRTPRDQRM